MEWSQIKPLPFVVTGFVLLIALTLVLLGLVQRANDDAAQAMNAIRTIAGLSDTVTNIRRAESSQRGFLITNDPQHLTEFEPSAAAAIRLIDTLKPNWAAGSEAGDVSAELARAAEQKIAELRATVAKAREGNRDQALARLKDNTGFRLMSQIEADAAKLIEGERSSLAAQSERSKTFGQLITGAGIFAMVLTLGMAAITVFALQKSLNHMAAAQQALTALNDSLEQTVTDRTRNLKEANQEIQNFASTVSHDLRAPLVNIMGFTAEVDRLKTDLLGRLKDLRAAAGSDGMADQELSDEIDESLGFIKSSTARMDKLINAILAIAREGNRVLRAEEIDMTALVNTLAETHAHRAQQADVEIVVDDLPPLTTDRLAIEQIFGNLLDNAVKFLRSGVAGRIRVSGHVSANQVVYEVTDNGRGIDAKDRFRVFTPFRRAGVLDRPGDGVGLSHVRSLTRRLGGTIHFHPAVGEGTVFVVHLPRQFAPPEREGTEP